jgi:hypothetical protein
MRVSAGLPTGMEGLTYPIPFSDPENVIKIAQAAEKFGYDSVWGNDHMTTQNYVRAEFPVPPRFWEPLITYAFVLSETKTIKVGTGVIVLPMRHDIVVLAKQSRRWTISARAGSRSALASAPIVKSSRHCSRMRRWIAATSSTRACRR